MANHIHKSYVYRWFEYLHQSFCSTFNPKGWSSPCICTYIPPCYSSPAPLPLPNLTKSPSRLLPTRGTNRHLASRYTRYTRYPPHTRTHTPRHNHTPRTASRDTIRRHHTPPHFATHTHSRIESLVHSQSDTRRYNATEQQTLKEGSKAC